MISALAETGRLMEIMAGLLLVMGDGIVVMDDSSTRCASKCTWEQEEAGWSNSVGQNKKLVRTTVNSCERAHHERSG